MSLQNLLDAVDLQGWMFTDARFLAAEVELDRQATKGVVPRGLRLDDPARATLFVAHYPSTSFVSVYREVGLFVRVRHLLGSAVHCPWMLVDDDIALIAGRELLGYPKKIGEIELELGDKTASAIVDRRGTRLLSMEAEIGDIDPNPPPMLGQPVLNAWGPVGLSLQRLLWFEPKEEVIEARHAEISITVGSSERDPLGSLGIGRVLSGHFYRVNIGGRRVPIPLLPLSPTFWVRNFRMRYQ